MSDVAVEFTYENVGAFGNVPGPFTLDLMPYIVDIVPTLDIDAVRFGTATLTFADLPDGVFAALNPLVSGGVQVTFRIRKWARDLTTGVRTIVDSFPGTQLYGYAPDAVASMYVRRARRVWGTALTTIEAATSECMLEDKIRVAATTLNTGAANVNALTTYSLTDVFGAGTPLADPLGAASVLIPAGDRRLMLQGQSHWDLNEAEVSAAGGRLFADITFGFALADRAQPPRDVSYSTVTLDTWDPTSSSEIVTEYVEEYDRDSDYADGILARFTYNNASGTQVIGYQASGLGVNTKGRVIDYNRPAPAANQANAIVARAALRGRTFTVTGRCTFKVRPGYTLMVRRPSGTINRGLIRATTWRPSEGVVDVTTQIGVAD